MMPAAMSVTKLAETVGRICAQMQLRTDELNALDAELGDGDLGSTLSAVSCAAIPMLDRTYPDIGSFLNELARTLAATSGSSFSALVMFGLLKTAGHMTGRPVLEQESIPSAGRRWRRLYQSIVRGHREWDAPVLRATGVSATMIRA